ncbi:MAG: hypothetical protein ACR2K0_01045 [Acidimicrobiales bacterium]
MSEALRDLLASAAEPPTRPVEPAALRRRAHRRSRSVGAGAAGAALVLVSVVAVVATVGGPGPSQLALEDTAPTTPPPPTAVGEERPPPVAGPAVPEPSARDTPGGLGAPSDRPPAPGGGRDPALPGPAPATGAAPAVEEAPQPPPDPGPPVPSEAPVPPPPEPAEQATPAVPAPEVAGDQAPSRRTVALPTHDEGELAGAVHSATVVGDGDRDGGCAWLVVDGRPRAVRWEAGSTARFTTAGDGAETVEVLDGAGNVVTRGGEELTVVADQRPERLDRCHVGEESVVWYIAIR